MNQSINSIFKSAKSTTQQISIYLRIITIYFLIMAWLLSVMGNVEMQLWINKVHAWYLDFLFKNMSMFGNAWFCIVLLPVLFYFSKLKNALFISISCLLTLPITQIPKHFIFYGSLRPHAVLGSQLHIVEGIKILNHHSFPSGHNMLAFAMCTALAWIMKGSRKAQIWLAIIAILIGFSRVYLQQHWVIDALAGQLFGVMCVPLASYIMKKFVKNK